MRALAIAAALTLAVGGSTATARPLPDTGIRVEKPIVGTITIINTAAGVTQVVPGGDLAVGYACDVATGGDGSGSAVCVQDAGDGYVFTCNRVTVADARAPGVRATAYCADDTTDIRADYNSGDFGRYNGSGWGAKLAANRVYCAAVGAMDTPYTVTCTFKVLSVSRIDGVVTISQATATSPVVVTTSGVLAVSSMWECSLDIGTPPPPPTVTCERGVDKTIDWFCGWTDVQATAPGPLPSVRGQVSCDGNKAPIVGRQTGQTLSTDTVPLGGVTTDYTGASLDYPTEVFICQAWGPLNTPVPIAPWTVRCDEP